METTNKFPTPAPAGLRKIAEYLRAAADAGGICDVKQIDVTKKAGSTIASIAGHISDQRIKSKQRTRRGALERKMRSRAHFHGGCVVDDACYTTSDNIASELKVYWGGILPRWANENPEIWGNKFGLNCLTREAKYECELNLRNIAKHFDAVADRIEAAK